MRNPCPGAPGGGIPPACNTDNIYNSDTSKIESKKLTFWSMPFGCPFSIWHGQGFNVELFGFRWKAFILNILRRFYEIFFFIIV